MPPAVRLRGEHDEQRRGVDRAVVAPALGERVRAALPPEFVEDLAGSSSDSGRVVVPCRLASTVEHAHRQVRYERERHPGGQDRVAPEQRHEPRRAGRDHDVGGVRGVEDAQRGEVGEGPVERAGQAFVVRVDPQVGLVDDPASVREDRFDGGPLAEREQGICPSTVPDGFERHRHPTRPAGRTAHVPFDPSCVDVDARRCRVRGDDDAEVATRAGLDDPE